MKRSLDPTKNELNSQPYGSDIIKFPSIYNKSKPNTINKYACSKCRLEFKDFQEFYKHDLLLHVDNVPSQKGVRKSLKMLERIVASSDANLAFQLIQHELDNCQPSEELQVIFRNYCADYNHLQMVCDQIYDSLVNDLRTLRCQGIFLFGSFINGLALKDCDLDLYIDCVDRRPNSNGSEKNRRPNAMATLNKITKLLYRSARFVDIVPIRQARVPIIKCAHASSGMKIDINISCPSSLYNSTFVRELLEFDIRLHELMLFLKIWGKQLQLIGRGALNSYCLIMLVIFYLQQNRENHSAIIPCIKTLQRNVKPHMIMGVNYAYDLESHMKPIPKKLTTLNLIKDFLKFYLSVDFENSIIAPYLGKIIPLADFKNGLFDYEEYKTQMELIMACNEENFEELQTNKALIVQDPFNLMHNIGKTISKPKLTFLHRCLQCAYSICTDPIIRTDTQLYKALLFGIIEKLTHTKSSDILKSPKIESVKTESISNQSNQGNTNGNSLLYCFSPIRSEIRLLTLWNECSPTINVFEQWVKMYINIIQDIITLVYGIEMQLASPGCSDKHKKLESLDNIITWTFSGSVDLWTGRIHQRSQNFMKYQMDQTEKLSEARRQDPQYAVDLSGILTVRTLKESQTLELSVTKPDKNSFVSKKDPLRRFFSNLKISLQNFNINEKLQSNAGKDV